MTQNTTFRTTCAYCGVGCGVLATPDGMGGMKIEGDPDHPANYGRLCSKGSALGETVGSEGRLMAPMIGNQQASWDDALDLVADKFKSTIAEHGPDSVAFYVSGQLLTEDYYVANKLMKGYIGSANIDTNSRLCMASTVAGHKRAFGTDTVPGTYEDLEEADLIVLVGSNLAWCHPVLFQRIAAAKAARPGMKVINIDPRVTATSDLADIHLAIEPGSDVALFNHLLSQIELTGSVDHDFIRKGVDGFDAAIEAARANDASITGLSEVQLAEFVKLWIGTEKVVTVFSQGVNQSTSGADKVNSILNCHLATGRIGKPGMGPFSVTGQPNAMGGREVGGLANMLACHLDIENADHRDAVQDFWASPTIPTAPGAKAVDMFRKVGDGQIKAIWIMCTNPAVSMPDAAAVRDAIKGCDFVVVSDMFATTDTAKLADVILPATGWSEKDGTVTNSERVISRQRALMPPTGASRHDWAVLADVGRRMGWSEAFDYERPADVFREYAAMSALGSTFGRDFDISALADISDREYETFAPARWPLTDTRQGGRFFADGKFFTDTGRARMLALTHRAPIAKRAPKYPFFLNTGRVRDHWHTMTRTAQTPRLSQHLAEPYLEIHPDDAADLGLGPAELADVTSPHGRCILRVMISDKTPKGSVFAPIHWTSEYASAGLVDQLVAPEVDPVSGQPESKASVVAIKPYAPKWYGFAVSSGSISPETGYWAKARAGQGWRAELAHTESPEYWEAAGRAMFGLEEAQVVSISDPSKGITRLAFVVDGQVKAALFAAPEPIAVSRSFLVGAFDKPAAEILAGRPGGAQPDPGPTLCSCFGIGVNTIIDAVETQGLISVDAIGAALGAGTNCGSCKPELAALLNNIRTRDAAE